MPQRITDLISLSLMISWTGGRHMENLVLSNTGTSFSATPNSGTEFPKPFGYCSVATIGSSKTLKALSNLLDTSTICGKYWMLLLNFSCKSHRNKQAVEEGVDGVRRITILYEKRLILGTFRRRRELCKI